MRAFLGFSLRSKSDTDGFSPTVIFVRRARECQLFWLSWGRCGRSISSIRAVPGKVSKVCEENTDIDDDLTSIDLPAVTYSQHSV